MSKRTAIAIATLAAFCSFAPLSWAADAPAKGKSSEQHAACADHVKKMKAMKTTAERDTYCKGDSACSSNHCEAMMTHHHAKTQHHAAAPAPKPAPN
jgi:hypothetical protein